MKRGLKGLCTRNGVLVNSCCTNYPDEKGTESYDKKWKGGAAVSCSNYTDEKGTESPSPGCRHRQFPQRCTNYPDEKGTESPLQPVVRRHDVVVVALITPMKRGLKGFAR